MATVRIYPADGIYPEPYDADVQGYDDIDRICKIPELSCESKTFVRWEGDEFDFRSDVKSANESRKSAAASGPARAPSA